MGYQAAVRTLAVCTLLASPAWAEVCPPAVAALFRDMALPHAAMPSGVPDYYDWAQAPRLGYGNDPGRFGAFIAWGQVYAAAGGSPATNTRVEIRNLRGMVLDAAGTTWRQMHPPGPLDGGAFREDFVDNTSVDADLRPAADDGVSVLLSPQRNYHFWPYSSRVPIGPAGIGGIVVTVQARLIVDDPALPDDREQARLMMSVGADYWRDVTVNWDDSGEVVSGDAAIGRFGFITPDWQTFTMTTLPEDVLCANPPPL